MMVFVSGCFCVSGLPTLYNLSFLRADREEVLKLKVERYVPSLSLYPEVHIDRCSVQSKASPLVTRRLLDGEVIAGRGLLPTIYSSPTGHSINEADWAATLR